MQDPSEEYIKVICPQPILPTPIMSADFLVCTYWLAGRGKDDNHNSGDALADALKENPRNASISIPVKDSADGPAEGPVQLALLTSKLWAPGRTLRVGFTQGTQCQQDKVRYFAPQWGQYANIKFDFPASGPYDISISFGK